MKKERRRFWYDQLLTMVGTLIYCVGINLFAVPAGLYSSGLLGLCQLIRTMLEQFLQLSFGTMDISGILYYIFNIPILLLAWRRLGKSFVIRTMVFVVWGVLLLSLIPTVSLLPGDPLAAGAIGGVISGIGIGMVLRASATLGGMDVISLMIIQKHKGFSVGGMNLALNLLVYSGCMLLFDIPTALYSVVSAVVYSVVVDRVHTRNIDVEATIITKEDASGLEQKLFQELGRGVTQLQGVGAYTQEGVSVLFVVLSQFEVTLLRQIVQNYDPHAFIVMKDHVKVLGNYERRL